MSKRESKIQRQNWWAGLNAEDRALYIAKKEAKRPKLELNIKPLTKREMRKINATMRSIGMADHIVLPNV